MPYNVTSIDYAPYGRKVKQTGMVKPNFGYAGMFEHGASGLNLTWYRAYSARDGRWLSEDPIGFEGGGNLFGYVGGDTVNFVDPLGLLLCRVDLPNAGINARPYLDHEFHSAVDRWLKLNQHIQVLQL